MLNIYSYIPGKATRANSKTFQNNHKYCFWSHYIHMKINRPVLGDAETILQIQKCAYLSESETTMTMAFLL